MIYKIFKVLSFVFLFLWVLFLNLWINNYFSGFKSLLLVSVLFFVLFIFIIYKNKFYKDALIYFVVLLVYALLYSYTNINNNHEYSFLENVNSNTYSAEELSTEYDLWVCLKEWICDYREAIEKKIKNINLLITNPDGLDSTSFLNYKLSKLLYNKQYLEERGLSYNFNIKFDVKNYIKASLINEYSKSLKSHKWGTLNLFFSKNQFDKYLENYYYEIFTSIGNKSIKGLYTYDNKSPLLYVINRRYIYNKDLKDSSFLNEFIKEITSAYNLVSEINKKQ